MSQEKEYVTVNDECGQINISREVIASIAAMACREVEGVSGMSAAEGGGKGVVIEMSEENSCSVSAHILVPMGVEVATVAAEAQKAIKNAVESTAGLAVKESNVYVAGITSK